MAIKIATSKSKQEIIALARLVNYMDLPKKRILMNVFANAQFNHCPTVWIFNSRSLKGTVMQII